MKKFLILYTSPTPAREEIGKGTPEEQQAGREAWEAWAKKAGDSIVELGAPLADAGGTHSKVTGFTIVQANSASDVEQILKDNPHRKMPGSSLEIHELLELPGMKKGPRFERELEPTSR
jgi:hypothetical protein